MEAGTIRRLGAEVVEYPVRPGDAIVGRRVRELGLPREALLNVIVRGEQAIPPRGSTMIEAGDRLHVLVRQEVAVEFRRALDVWRFAFTGPVVAIGSAQQVQDAARRRLRIAASDADAAWWREVIGALAVP